MYIFIALLRGVSIGVVIFNLVVLLEVQTLAVSELIAILSDAWEAADLRRRLGAWWWVVTHRQLLDD